MVRVNSSFQNVKQYHLITSIEMTKRKSNALCVCCENVIQVGEKCYYYEQWPAGDVHPHRHYICSNCKAQA